MAMSIRVASTKLRHLARPLNTASSSSIAAVSPITFAGKPDSDLSKQPIATVAADITDDSILNFEDVKGLFSSVSTAKLMRSSLTLQMASVEPMVDLGIWVMNSKLMETVILRDFILTTIKHTFYEHFCAGSDMEEVGRSVTKLSESGLTGMLDYGLEHATDNASCDHNSDQIIRTVKSVTSLPPSSVSFVVVKVTAICPVSLLRRVSDLLRWEYKNPCFKLQWKLNTLPIFSDSSPLYHTLELPDPLTPQEEGDLQLAHQRLEEISQHCLDANIPLLIDAEDTSIQPAIDYFTYSTAIVYNKEDNPIIFGTIQAYLKDAADRLLLAKKAADKMGVPMGVKLVRGAYMSSEGRLASSSGFESPIHNTIEQTHACYNGCASFMLEEMANRSAGLVLATHNVESGKLAAIKARELGIGTENRKLHFAQLYGMAEALSYGLRNAGFNVSKYVPFGPVDQIIPYLLRRAEENKGPLSSATLDIHLMRKELRRRLKATIL